MKKLLCIGVLLLLTLALCASAVFADEMSETAEGDGAWKLEPAIKFGYAFAGETPLVFQTRGVALLAAARCEYKIPSVSGVALEAELPYQLTDRINLAVGGYWLFSGSDDDLREKYNGMSTVGRTWKFDERDWYTVDATASYSFIKDAKWVKDLSASVGFRWDHQSIKFNNPYNPAGVASNSASTVSFKMNNYSPVFGVSSTFNGPKAGMFGGDITLAVSGGPIVGGDVSYDERFVATSIHFKGDVDDSAFYNIVGEATLLSKELGKMGDFSLSIFGQYTKFFVNSKVSGTTTPTTVQQDYDFSMRPSSATVGAKAALAF